MRAAVLVLCVLLAGCAQQATPSPAQSEAQVAPAEAENATVPESPASAVGPPQATAGEAAMAGAITLMALGGHATPTDELGLTFTLPEGYTNATITLSWNASLPTNDALALRLHEPGVLDTQGRVVGSSRLVLEAAGGSPVVAALNSTIAPAGRYDVHAYTPSGEPAPVVAHQSFDLVVRWA